MDVLTKDKNNSNDNFRKMIENLDVGFYKGDSDGNLLIYNRALKEILGFEPSKDLAGNLAEYFFKNKADQKKFYRELMEMGRVKDYIVQVKKPNGKIIMVQINAHVVIEFDDKLTTIEGNVIDISEIYQLEHRLNESEENCRTFMETAKDFMHIIDNKGKIIYANRDFFGYNKEELMNMRITELIAEEELPIFALELKSLIGNGSITLTDLSCKSKDGTKIIGELSAVAIYGIDGKFNGAISIFNDITERKKMEEKLLNNEELFRDFFESAAVGFHIFGPDRIITKMNEYELNLLGYSREEIIDKKTWYDIIIPEQRSQFEKHWNDILEKGSVKNLEYTLIHKDGHFIDVLLNASSRFDEKGNLINTRGSVIDITRRRKVEQALRESEHSLGERIKELNCLYGISQLVEKPEVSSEEIIRGTLELIPPAWQFPEVTCARITYDKKLYETENFKETEWKLTTRVEVNEKPMEIEVYYLEVNPFLKEEINLINDIGKRLKVIFEHMEAEQKLKESEEKLKKLNLELEQRIDERTKDLKESEYDLGERVKELNCLFELSKLVRSLDCSLGVILRGTLDLIPPAWQFPEITCARISLNGQEFKTKNFKETTWKQKADIKGRNEIIGTIEVYYLKDKPIFDEGPFLKEERNLINALAEILGRYLEREMAEQKLKESEEKFRALFNNTNDSIFILDRDIQFIEVNQTAYERLGYTREELLKLNPKSITPPEYKIDLQANIKTLFEKGATVVEAEQMTKDGDRFPVEIGSRIFNFGGKKAIISVARDISERKVVEQKLKESEKQYHESYNRANFYKDLFAHDINNILQIITSSADIISIQLGDFEKSKILRNFTKIINQQVKRGVKLVKNVHILSKLEEENIIVQPIKVDETLRKSIEFIKKSYKDRQLHLQVDSADVGFIVQANLLLQDVFENILINGVKYNENPNIEILIRISKVQIDNTGFIRMEFIDNGIGIPDDRKEIIFKKGNRKLKGDKGMGLGLSLVSKIISSFNGKIRVVDKTEGNYSKGCNFIIELPIKK